MTKHKDDAQVYSGETMPNGIGDDGQVYADFDQLTYTVTPGTIYLMTWRGLILGAMFDRDQAVARVVEQAKSQNVKPAAREVVDYGAAVQIGKNGKVVDVTIIT